MSLGCAKSSEEGVSRAVAEKRSWPHSLADILHPEGGGGQVWQPELQAWGLGGPILSDPVRPGHGRARAKRQGRSS